MDTHFIHFSNSLGRRYCTVRYLATNQLLSVVWKGTASEESIKEVKEGVLQMVRKYKCHALINDIQDFFTAPSHILAKLAEADWDKEIYKLGVRYIAHVLRPESELPDEAPEGAGNPGLNFFHHKMDALEWINSKTTGIP